MKIIIPLKSFTKRLKIRRLKPSILIVGDKFSSRVVKFPKSPNRLIGNLAPQWREGTIFASHRMKVGKSTILIFHCGELCGNAHAGDILNIYTNYVFKKYFPPSHHWHPKSKTIKI
jgi:hypothetical protein